MTPCPAPYSASRTQESVGAIRFRAPYVDRSVAAILYVLTHAITSVHPGGMFECSVKGFQPITYSYGSPTRVVAFS